jgi:ankyrin repeat protein
MKLSPSFYDNPNDVYWKELVSTVTVEKTPDGTTHRNFYESFIYEKTIKQRFWDEELLTKIVKDRVFLTRHINVQDGNGNTALMYASDFDSNKEEAKILLNAGADVNIKNNRGSTALFFAAGRSGEEILKHILSLGADVDHKNLYDHTALMHASNRGKKGNVEVLLAAGANVYLVDSNGNTALDHASDEDIKILLSKSF